MRRLREGDVKTVLAKTIVTVAALCGLAGAASAASVKTVNAKKSLVMIDLEEDETVEKGTEICFYTGAGKKVDCGSVVKVKNTTALVKVEDEEKLKKIKAGMAAKIGAGDAADDDEDKGDKDKDKGDKKKKKVKKKKKKKNDEDDDSDAAAKGDDDDNTAKSAKPSKKSPLRIWASYGPALATPATFNKIGYLAPTTTTPTTLWAPDKGVSSTLVGFDLQVGIPIGNFSLDPGLRYRKMTPSLVDADYNPQHENPYVSTEQDASAIGLWVDFQYFRKTLGKSAAIDLTTGLDMDMETVTVSANKKDDTGATTPGPVASATSKIAVFSLRLGAALDVIIAKPFGLSFGVNLLVPLASGLKSFSGNFASGEGQGLADPGADLQSAIGLRKNSFGAEATLGIVLAF